MLVIGIGAEGCYQQTRVAVGAQRSVNFVQIAFAGFDGEPVDEFAHQGPVDFTGALIVVFVDKHNVQVAAVAQLQAAELAVGNDGQLGLVAVAGFQADPAPVGAGAQHRLRQGTQVVGHLLHRQPAFNVSHQRAEHLGMVGAAQKVQQVFFIVLATGGERLKALRQFRLEGRRIKALAEHGVAGKLVNHPRMGLQIARRPARSAQDPQQALLHQRPFVQQGQIAFAAQQRLHPIHEAHTGQLSGPALRNPLRGALHQPQQSRARFVPQRQHTRVGAPMAKPLSELALKQRQRCFKVQGRACPCVAGVCGTFALRTSARCAAQERVKLMRHQLAVGVELGQKRTRTWKRHGLCQPSQIRIVRGQHMGLLVVQVLNAVFHLAQKYIGRTQGLRGGGGHQSRFGQARQGAQRRAGAQLRKLPAAHHLEQLHGEFNFADPAARQLHVVVALGSPGTALGGMVADLAVQHPQGIKHAIVQVAPEHKGHDDGA